MQVNGDGKFIRFIEKDGQYYSVVSKEAAAMIYLDSLPGHMIVTVTEVAVPLGSYKGDNGEFIIVLDDLERDWDKVPYYMENLETGDTVLVRNFPIKEFVAELRELADEKTYPPHLFN